MSPQIAIIIPARYGSSRFPGKPLANLRGEPLLKHVVGKARACEASFPGDLFVGVATDDRRILEFCSGEGVSAAMTSPDLETGSDRTRAALAAFKIDPEIIINLQGDNPLVPVAILSGLISALLADKTVGVATPVIRLTWEGLDRFRVAKKDSPLSGTTCVIAPSGDALWFSKQILPAIRGEAKLRAESNLSPVFRHVGVYGFRRAALEQYAALPKGRYEELEGLEQLRFLENGMPIRTVPFPAELMPPISGIDSRDDLLRAEKFLETSR